MQDLAYSSPSKGYPLPPPVLRISSKHAGLRDYECAQCETGLRFQSLTGKILMSKDLGPRVRSSPDPTESFGCTMISGFWSWRKVRCHTLGAIGCGKVTIRRIFRKRSCPPKFLQERFEELKQNSTRNLRAKRNGPALAGP